MTAAHVKMGDGIQHPDGTMHVVVRVLNDQQVATMPFILLAGKDGSKPC